MAELIDRKEIFFTYSKKDKEEYGNDFAGGVLFALDKIDEMPTIEAKPVVYCKDCKYNVANSKHEPLDNCLKKNIMKPLDITDYTDITCEYFMTDGMSPNDYCSQGRRVNE